MRRPLTVLRDTCSTTARAGRNRSCGKIGIQAPLRSVISAEFEQFTEVLFNAIFVKGNGKSIAANVI